MKNIIEILTERGLLENMTSEELVTRAATPMTVYAGYDPTSDSLQAGNLAAIITLMHFQRCGHQVVALMGGATGMIGDPSGKLTERKLLDEAAVAKNIEGIGENLTRVMATTGEPFKLVNNQDWLGAYRFIDFLRDVGKHFRMGTMLGKDSVKSRLSSEEGMSFTEFSYQMLQAYDFMHLFDTEGCVLQIGGSDQWGNITAGIDLIHKLRGKTAYGMTIPLICDSNGQKFGKSEGNAVYLDPRKTSCYDFYQFFVRQTDADVVRLLKVYTFLDLHEIGELEVQVREAPEKRLAQHRLAEEVTRLVHGEAGLKSARQATEVLFGGAIGDLSADELMAIFKDVPSATVARAAVADQPALDVVVAAGLCKSRGEAKRLIESGGLYVNNHRVTGLDAKVAGEAIVGGRVLILRSGKKSYCLVKIG